MESLLGGDVHKHGVAAILFGNQAVLGELSADLVRVGALLINLVDRHDDRHVGRLGVVEGLDGLGHDAVVGGHDEDGDVGHLGTAGAHGCEGLVTGGVDEGDRTLLVVQVDAHLIGADGLGDAPGLAGDDVGGADRVQQLGLTVVDVTHDRDHRGPWDEVGIVLIGLEVDIEGFQQLAVLVLGRDDLDVVAQLGAQEGEGVLVEGLGGRGHLTKVEQDGHQGRGVGVDLLGQVRQRRPLAHTHRSGAVTTGNDDAADRRRALLLEFLALCPLRLASPRSTAAASEGPLGGTAATAATARPAEAAGTATAATTGPAATTRARAASPAACASACRSAGTADGGLTGHHTRVGTGSARTRGTGASCRLRPGTALGTGTTGTRPALGTRATRAAGAGHALGGGEGVVPRARRARTRLTRALTTAASLAGHALGGGEGVVPRARRTGARSRRRGVAARPGRRGAGRGCCRPGRTTGLGGLGDVSRGWGTLLRRRPGGPGYGPAAAAGLGSRGCGLGGGRSGLGSAGTRLGDGGPRLAGLSRSGLGSTFGGLGSL